MSLYELRTKFDVVMVTRKSKGSFPGPSSPKGTLGLVWSQWISNEKFGSYKLSLLDKSGDLTFTTFKCIEKLGEITLFEDLVQAYIKHADQHFVPIFCHIGDRASIARVNRIWVRPLSKNKNYSLLISAIHPEDLKELITDTDQSFFCLRLEPWVLKKWDLI
jgi:hypothetical protein